MVPSVFEEEEKPAASHLLDEVSDVSDDESAQPTPSTQSVPSTQPHPPKDDANPWLAAATDNVSHSASRKKEEAEEAVDVGEALSNLEKKPSKKREVVTGDLGFEGMNQEELMNLAFTNADADAEKEFEEMKKKDIEENAPEEKPTVLEGWGSWAGIVGVCWGRDG